MFAENVSKWEQLCAFTEEFWLRHDVPGVLLGVLPDGEVKIAGFGVTNTDRIDAPPTPLPAF